MSILEQESFISSIHPFGSLTINQLALFVENIDIVYFKENETIQKQGKNPEFLFFILKNDGTFYKKKTLVYQIVFKNFEKAWNIAVFSDYDCLPIFPMKKQLKKTTFLCPFSSLKFVFFV